MTRGIKERTPFSPEPGQIYTNDNGAKYYCERLQHGSLFNVWMINIKSGWSFLAHGVGRYPDGTIDWDYSTDGRFTDFRLQEA